MIKIINQLKKNGVYLVDKTKIYIMFSSGQSIICMCSNEKDGQEMFNIISNAMQEIVINK